MRPAGILRAFPCLIVFSSIGSVNLVIDPLPLAEQRRHGGVGRRYLPERLETSADDDAPADTRTPEERDRAAVNAWMHWHGMVQRLNVSEREAIWDGVYMRTRLHHGGKLRANGSAFVRALRFLEEAASYGS